MLRTEKIARCAQNIRAAGRALVLTALALAAMAPSGGARAQQQSAPLAQGQAPASGASDAVTILTRVPPPPSAVGAAKAYAVLDRHCARCHQDGRLKNGAASQGFANILALDEIARVRALVQPGAPDASRLYTSILSRRMPYDVYHGQGVAAPGAEEPSADDVQVLRDWINELPPNEPGSCSDRAKVTSETIAEQVGAAIAEAGPAKAKSLRFLSLVHLHNACATPKEMSAFRQGVTHLVNSLSWTSTPVRVEPICPEQAILKLVLTDVGWIAAHWDQLASAYPLRLAPSARLPQPIIEATGTRTPLIAADWMADAAMHPPLYYELLGLPSRFGNLQRILRVDIDNNTRRGLARRAGLAQSNETRAGRVVERHPASTGGMWLAYDLAGGNGRQNVLEHPLGPSVGEPSRTPFRHEGLKALFHLPNGFAAFALNDARGDRSDRSPADVEKEGLGQAVQPGSQCLQCHRTGPVGVRDEVRAHIENDRTATKELRDAVTAIYAPEPELAKLVETDQAHTLAAFAAVGLDPDLRLWGLDPVSALGQAWRRRVTLSRAASDFGVDPQALEQRLSTIRPELGMTARLIRQGGARREDVNRLFAELATPAPAGSALPPAAGGAQGGDRLELALWSDGDAYVAGQAATLYVQSNQDCHLTLINVDRSGRATVLFPNEFEQNNLIVAGREHRVPGADSPYRFRLKERGRESFVAVCTKTAKAPDGVFHDFERLRFTVLGDWQIFLREPPALEEARRDDAASERPRPQQQQRRPARGRPEAPRVPPVSTGPDQQVRTSISVDVR